MNESSTASTKEGFVKKCPACGALVQRLSANCSECGQEFRGTEAVRSSAELGLLLAKVAEDTRAEYAARPPTLYEPGLHPVRMPEAIAQAQASIISTFPIPNTREDLVEFLAMAVGESEQPIQSAALWGVKSASEILVPAWRAKASQALLKAKVFLGYADPFVRELDSRIAANSRRAAVAERLKIFKGPMGFALLCLAFLVLLVCAGGSESGLSENDRGVYEERCKGIQSDCDASCQYRGCMKLCKDSEGDKRPGYEWACEKASKLGK